MRVYFDEDYIRKLCEYETRKLSMIGLSQDGNGYNDTLNSCMVVRYDEKGKLVVLVEVGK